MNTEYIELERTFRALPDRMGKSDEFDFDTTFGIGKHKVWTDLLAAYRIILLSEAGTGKTEEIRQAAKRQYEIGKPSFFLRLEHVADDFEIAFEPVAGSHEEFVAWLESDEEGWLFLDSVDEARLRDPLEFQGAIRKIGALTKPAHQRAHILISSRGSAWRPISDLKLCREQIPFRLPQESEKDEPADGDRDVFTTESGGAKISHSREGEIEDPFQILKLDDLSVNQVRRYAEAKGIVKIDEFIEEIERGDAWLLTHRPQDLEELVGFWLEQGRIGNRLEIMEQSIAHRLQETSQERDEARPLAGEKAMAGAKLLAAATTLTQQSAIRVPDGAHNKAGLAASEILVGWEADEIQTLLGRPVFDEALYGTARFHHRSQREYLTARWFEDLLLHETSRREIEGMFFKEQYGLNVLTPVLRPVLAWLVLFDARIRQRALALAPELVFEGGEPAALPLETRQRVLGEVSEAIARGEAGRGMMDYAAVQRFANPDLADDIRKLIARHSDNDDLLWFLLRMAWQGRIQELLPEAKHHACREDAGKYVRTAAIRALLALGSDDDARQMRADFLIEGRQLRRDLLAEQLAKLPGTEADVDWLIRALRKTKPKKQYSSEVLGQALLSWVAELPLARLPQLVEGLARLLRLRPIKERRFFEVSERFSWLLNVAALAVERMVVAKHPACFEKSPLYILYSLPTARDYHDYDLNETKTNLPTIVPDWTELNDALFWHAIAVARRNRNKVDERTTDYWEAHLWRSYCRFRPEDFERIAGYIETRSLRDDRLVALTLAFQLYREAGRPQQLRRRLKKITKGKSTLEAKLQSLLHPPKQDAQTRKLNQRHAVWERRHKAREKRRAQNREEWKAALKEKPELVRDPKLKKPDQISNWQFYFHEEMRSLADRSGHWTHGEWRLLEEEFGEEVAKAFREAATSYWRRNIPKVLSDGKVRNSTPFSTIFGLCGLAIESIETENWAGGLSTDDAQLAFRYAMNELNGFPDWFPSLYEAHAALITELLTVEAGWELRRAKRNKDSHYVIDDLMWSGAAFDSTVAPLLLAKLVAEEPKNTRLLEQILAIVCRSSKCMEALKEAGRFKSAQRSLEHAAIWFAIWAGVDPENAIPALRERLQTIARKKDRVRFAMVFITRLAGNRREGALANDGYQMPQHLRDLIILMNETIEAKDDIHRAGKGTYSPGLRDDAQDARSQLFSMLKEIPGKEAFLAIQSLAELHPEGDTRPWMRVHAKSKAETEADLDAWLPSQVSSFAKRHERIPANHRQLAELAHLRLLDLKAGLEDGDSSVASILKDVDQETEMRKFIGQWLRETARGRYSIPQEEEFADAKRADLRFHLASLDAPVPVELKLADNWSGPDLFERMRNQLCGDYLRDDRSNRGFFVLVYRGEKQQWELPDGVKRVHFLGLVDTLQAYWFEISAEFPGIEDIKVVGIDLTKRK